MTGDRGFAWTKEKPGMPGFPGLLKMKNALS